MFAPALPDLVQSLRAQRNYQATQLMRYSIWLRFLSVCPMAASLVLGIKKQDAKARI